ncbi:unnamed protein product, partial [Pylaiella littoralis]
MRYTGRLNAFFVGALLVGSPTAFRHPLLRSQCSRNESGSSRDPTLPAVSSPSLSRNDASFCKTGRTASGLSGFRLPTSDVAPKRALGTSRLFGVSPDSILTVQYTGMPPRHLPTAVLPFPVLQS